MKISLNWVREFTDIKIGTDELVAKIGSQLGEVEEVIHLGGRYKDIVIARVVSCEKHPNADKLSVCLIDDGGVTPNVKRVSWDQAMRAVVVSSSERVAEENVHNSTLTEQRSEEGENTQKSGSVSGPARKQGGRSHGLVQVVCGAPNVKAGLTIAWIPPGAIVPSTFDKEQFKLEVRPLRGVDSNGMIASGAELGINDDHSGILVIDKPAEPGTYLADVYGLNDVIIDIENKMFTHRPDCFGILGVAREIAGIQNIAFTSPDWYKQALEIIKPDNQQLKLEVKNELPELVPRFMAVAMSNVVVGPSPIQMQSYLQRVGIKPINNIVDITNFVMALTAQPLHAFDYDKVTTLDNSESATIVVRHPKEGEEISLLNGKTIKPRKEAIMIASDTKLLAVGGVMGGTDTEVDENTKNIILECANFDMYSIRKTSMVHGLFTDAVTRFNKGQSPLQNDKVLGFAVSLLNQQTDATASSELIDINNTSVATEKDNLSIHGAINISVDFINQRLGSELLSEDIQNILANVEFGVEVHEDELSVIAPFWRADIEIPEDIVEEVGRLYGYDLLLKTLPRRVIIPAQKNRMLDKKAIIRSTLTAAGANELLTYSFVDKKLLDIAGQDSQNAFQLANALSPELQYYRLSLMPSLLSKVHANIKAGFSEFAMFELNKVHSKQWQDNEGLPVEQESLSFVFAADRKSAGVQYRGAAFYQARLYLQHLFSSIGRGLPVCTPLDSVKEIDSSMLHMVAPFEPTRAAVLQVRGEIIGVIGEFRQEVSRGLKLPEFCAGFELDIAHMPDLVLGYEQLQKYPSSTQDISLEVSNTLQYQQLITTIWEQLESIADQHGYKWRFEPIDIYQKDADAATKRITVRLELSHPDKTLVTSEVNHVIDLLAATARDRVSAERV
jgi:phenylalanyl-tRNA synthetase beta chain